MRQLPAAAWALWSAVAALLLLRLVRDAQLLRRASCDTTYLWEGYEEVPMGGAARYRLIKFTDGDTGTTAALGRLKRQHGHVAEVPVLFVHGHLGTHQQMRSAASETGRELARRAAASEGAGAPIWLHWYAADFNAEASALDAALLDEQAGFVVRCISHLRELHAHKHTGSGASPAAQPEQAEQQQQQQQFRLVLVAYSMGGLVARRAVHRLAADLSFDLGQLVALVMLGSPDHFPCFMPHTPISSLLGFRAHSSGSSAYGSCTVAADCALFAPAGMVAGADAVPRANILAGAGDFSLPHTHALMAGHGPPVERNPAELTLLMRDMPGVWTTCSHKGIVSCNQLLRQLVPVLVDTALASLEDDGRHGSTPQRQAAVQAQLRQRLATNAGLALGLGPPRAVGGNSAAQHLQQWQACTAEIPAAAPAPASFVQRVTVPLLWQPVPPGHLVRLSWDGGHAAEAGWQGLLLLATAALPCTHWSVTAWHSNGTSMELAGNAAPLPALLQSLQQRFVPRHWQEIMAGINWQQNATRLLYVPFADGPTSQLASVDVAVQGSSSGSTAVLAHALQGHPLRGQAVLGLPPPGAAAELPLGHAAAQRLQLPQQAWPLGSSACADCSPVSSMGCVAQLLVGSTPPWNLRIQVQRCSGGGDSGGSGSPAHPRILPALVGVHTSASLADSVRVAGLGGFSGSGRDEVVELWNGVAPLDRLLLISDPSCTYTLRLEWDVSGWLGLTLRHLLFILPALCMAISQARLSALRGSTARVAAAAAVLGAWGSQHPRMLLTPSGVMRPWVRLSVAEALAVLALAGGGAYACSGLAHAVVQLLQRTVPTKPSQRLQLVGWLGVSAVVASCLLPPVVPALLGCLCLAVRLAATTNQLRHESRSGVGPIPSHPLAWLVFSSQVALLPAVELVGLLLGSTRPAMAWTDGQALVAALAAHTCLLRTRERCGAAGWRRLVCSAAHEAAACAAAAAALWGHPWAVLYAAGLSAVAEAVFL